MESSAVAPNRNGYNAANTRRYPVGPIHRKSRLRKMMVSSIQSRLAKMMSCARPLANAAVATSAALQANVSRCEAVPWMTSGIETGAFMRRNRRGAHDDDALSGHYVRK